MTFRLGRTEAALLCGLPLLFLSVGLALKPSARPVSPIGATSLEDAKVYVHLLFRLPKGMLSVQVDNYRNCKRWFSGNPAYYPPTSFTMTPEEDRQFRLNLARAAQSQSRIDGPFHVSLRGKLGELQIDQTYDKGTTREIEAMLKGPPFNKVLDEIKPL